MSTVSNDQNIVSVGLDIGTTTTQLVISRLTVKNVAPGAAVPRMEIVRKEIIHRSHIHFTPLKDYDSIDAVGVARIVEAEYRTAGITAAQIDTGAVIITGETAKKENAQNIIESMAGLAGDFVVATAGANLESILAGKGSGAAGYSRKRHRVVVNIDIGGGTSNIGVFRDGKAIDTACLNIGGRLIELEPEKDKIMYVAPPARAVLRELGLSLSAGERVELADLKTVTQLMAKCITEVISSTELSTLTRELLMTSPLRLNYPVEVVMISGGVADYVYRDFQPMVISQVSGYGDIGPLLGWAVREDMKKNGLCLEKPGETLRATVIGAGTHSVGLSGSTISVKEESLPLRNVPVISPFPQGIPDSVEEIGKAVEGAVEQMAVDGAIEQLALAIQGPKTPTFAAIQSLAKGIVNGAKSYISEGYPLVVVLNTDFAKVLGQSLQREIGKNAQIICIDQVRVDEGDYIDIGKPFFGGKVVPVVVKTLVFDSAGG